MSKSRALITGASAGIGREFAWLLASEGRDLVLVARGAESLNAIADQIRAQHAVEVEVQIADLSNRGDLARIEDRLRDTNSPIDVLINNAGLGLNQQFSTGDLEREQYLIDLLIIAQMRLTHAAVSTMRARGTGDVVLVSSVASFIAGGSYSAVKSWATVFVEGLAQELRGKGVRVSALCPGFTHTEFHERAGIAKHDIPSWMWLRADRMVAAGWADHHRGKVVSVPDWRYKSLVALIRILPREVVRRVGFRARNHNRD